MTTPLSRGVWNASTLTYEGYYDVRSLQSFGGRGTEWDEERVRTVRHPRQPFTLPEPASRAEWEAEQRKMRERVLLAAGLWPEEERPPLDVHWGREARFDDFSVQPFWFETRPGLVLTGTLFRPQGRLEPMACVLNPHGHSLKEGRTSNTAWSVGLARLGFVAISYDMVGAFENNQIGHSIRDLSAMVDGSLGDHPPTLKLRRASRSPLQTNGTPGDLWGLSLFGLQVWNSLRILDLACSLPFVDARRIGCTGASGGGSQTTWLAAADERLYCPAPVCSGNSARSLNPQNCECDNGPALYREGLSGAHFMAACAPRPSLDVSAEHCYTKMTARVEGPWLKRIYALFDAADRVAFRHFPEAVHNGDKFSREATYAWFRRWLQDDASAGEAGPGAPSTQPEPDCGYGSRKAAPPPFLAEGPIAAAAGRPHRVAPTDNSMSWEDSTISLPEPSAPAIPPEALRAFPEGSGPPETFPRGTALCAELLTQQREKTERMLGESDDSALRDLYERVVLARVPGLTEFTVMGSRYACVQEGRAIWSRLLHHRKTGGTVPGLVMHPAGDNAYAVYARAGQTWTIIVHGGGKMRLFGADGRPRTLLRALLDGGQHVYMPDVFLTGEMKGLRRRYDRLCAKLVGKYPGVYGPTLLEHRIQDILTSVAYVKRYKDASRVNLVGLGEAGLWCLLAAPLAEEVDTVAADMDGAELAADEAWAEDSFLPLIRLAGDVRAALRLALQRDILVFNAPAEAMMGSTGARPEHDDRVEIFCKAPTAAALAERLCGRW